MNNQQITIIGGMGPQASLNLHGRLLKHAVKRGAKNGDDFPTIRHLSLSIKDFISDPSAKNEALARITKSLDGLYLWRGGPSRYSLQYCAFAFTGFRSRDRSKLHVTH